MKNIHYLIIFLFLTGCSSFIQVTKNSNLLNEIQIDKLQKNDAELIKSLYKDEWRVDVIKTKDYSFAYGDNGNMYVIRDGKVIVSIFENGKSIVIYAPHPAAPSAGTEMVIIEDNYIQYRSRKNVLEGRGLVFEDYGFDGVDVKYEFDNSLNAESFLNGKKCERTIVAGAACCTDSSGELHAYRFTPSTGWELSTNSKLVSNCQKKP